MSFSNSNLIKCLHLYKHRHIVQTPCEKEFSGKDKDMKDGTMLSFSQYEWTNNLTNVPKKIIIDKINGNI